MDDCICDGVRAIGMVHQDECPRSVPSRLTRAEAQLVVLTEKLEHLERSRRIERATKETMSSPPPRCNCESCKDGAPWSEKL